MVSKRKQHSTAEFQVTTPPSPGSSGVLVGQRVGGYRMDLVMGEGPRAYVYKGVQMALRRPVAIKILKQEFVTNVDRISDYLESARSAASLIHPNIVQVYDVVSMGDLHFVAAELVEAQTLEAWIASGRTMSPAMVVHVAQEACEALFYAHSAGRVHGNLVPNNIFIGVDERVRLADFCCRAFLETERPLREEELWRAAYLSPELLRGEESDARSDIFSLGVNLYHAVVGMPPYTLESVRLRFKSESDPPPAPRARAANPAVPTGLSDLLARMMSYEPAARPADVSELVVALQSIRQQLGEGGALGAIGAILKRDGGLPPPSRRSYRRMRADLDVKVVPRRTSEESAVMLLTKIKNLSENGAFVVTDEPLPAGAFVTLEFNLEAKKACVHVLGVVRWVEDGGGASGMGVQFLEVSTTDRKNLRDYVDERMVNEMARALTRTQIHKTILRMLLCSWGQELSFDRIVSITGASRILLQRTLSDFAKYNLVEIGDGLVRCLRPASQATVDTLNNALKN